MPISTRRIFMTDVLTATTRWWRISIAFSILACRRRIEAIWSPTSRRWVTACSPMSATAQALRSRRSTISTLCSAYRYSGKRQGYRRACSRYDRQRIARTHGALSRSEKHQCVGWPARTRSRKRQPQGARSYAPANRYGGCRRSLLRRGGRVQELSQPDGRRRPALLAGAERWSLFNPAVHDAHYAALRQVLQTKHIRSLIERGFKLVSEVTLM